MRSRFSVEFGQDGHHKQGGQNDQAGNEPHASYNIHTVSFESVNSSQRTHVCNSSLILRDDDFRAAGNGVPALAAGRRAAADAGLGERHLAGAVSRIAEVSCPSMPIMS